MITTSMQNGIVLDGDNNRLIDHKTGEVVYEFSWNGFVEYVSSNFVEYVIELRGIWWKMFSPIMQSL